MSAALHHEATTSAHATVIAGKERRMDLEDASARVGDAALYARGGTCEHAKARELSEIMAR